MRIGVVRETTPGERRVSLVPDTVGRLAKGGNEVVVERGAGQAASFPDGMSTEAGATIGDAWSAELVLKVAKPSDDELGRLREGTVLIAFLQPLVNHALVRELARRRLTALSMDAIPRITRAQPMDALSSQATVAGYKAVLLAAAALPKFFPMLTTAAGTIAPAKALVIGAGVAGLQAIATARRLGAVVEAFDTRPVVKEQVESLGARFVELPLETKDAQEKTGYAKAQTEEFYQKQQALMKKSVAGADVVITTALIPGKRAPVLITEDMVQAMRPGSIIVDLAAEQGGNCALTKPGQETVEHGVIILGPTNLPSTVPYHASQMYARTVTNYLLHLVKDGKINLDLNDELTRGPLVTHQGEILFPAAKSSA